MKENKKFYRTHRRAKRMLDNMLSSGDFEIVEPIDVKELIEIVTDIDAHIMVKESLAGRCSAIEWFEDRVKKHADKLRTFFLEYDEEEDIPEEDRVYYGLGDILGRIHGIFGFGDGTPADYWQVTKYPSAEALQELPPETFQNLYEYYCSEEE